MYPEHNQLDPNNPNCEESSAYPANPDSEYGWEKLFSERLFLSFHRNYGLDVRIGQDSTIYLDLKVHGKVVKKNHQRLCVVNLQRL
jgi:GDP-D-mannose 3', 5'-epimerase